MGLSRIEFLEKLETVSPALDLRESVVALSRLWFSGTEVIAFNGQMAIVVPYKTEFTGGIRGTVIIELMRQSKAKELDVEVMKNMVIMKAGRVQMKFPMLSLKTDFSDLYKMFTKYDFEHAPKVQLRAGVIDALERSLLSAGMDSSIPDQLGVTIINKDGKLNFYSTNSKMLSWSTIKSPDKYKIGRLVVPHTFTRELLKLSTKHSGGILSFTDQWVMAQFKDGVRIYSSLVNVERPLDWDKIIARNLDTGYDRLFVDIPKKLGDAIKRACILATSVPEIRPTKVMVKNGNMILVTRTAVGQVRDRIRLGSDHSDITSYLNPTLIEESISYTDKFAITPSGQMVMTDGENFVHIIAAMQR